MGMAMIVQQTASDEQVLIEADRAMYAAKRQAVDIIADSVQFLGSRDEAAPENGDMPAEPDLQPAPVPAGAGDEDIPF
jgi:single-stranded DNA-binding protein